MKLPLVLLRLGILITAVLVFAYSHIPVAIKAVCIAVVLEGYLSYE